MSHVLARRLVACVAAALLGFAFLTPAAPAAPAAHAAGETATFAKVSEWGSSWEGKYTITNGGTSPITGWRVEFDLPANTSIGSHWDSLRSSEGDHHVFTNREYNGTVAPGAAVTFGFLGTGPGGPTDCLLNGADCGGDGPGEPGSPDAPGAPRVTGTTSGSITLAWDSPGGTVTGYRVYRENSVEARTTGTSVTIEGLPSCTTRTFTVTAHNESGESPRSAPVTATTTGCPDTGLPRHALIGYLHASFANGSGYLRMADVPDSWDIVNLAFGEPTSVTSGDIRFDRCPVAECPNVESEAEFISAIRAKQAQGKKVLLSIGGQNGQVQLTTAAAREKFVSSVSAIIDRYGLDGLDVDFEGHSLYLERGDTDFRNPTTPVIVNLISALRTLTDRYGRDFVLTMAPETFFVQVGYQFYGGTGAGDNRTGSYLPVIHALRDELTVLHVQDYNSGPVMGLDNQYHNMGDARFHIAMTDMVKAGFPVANTGHTFPGLRADQIGFGLPAAVSAGNGYTPPAQVHQALDCLTRGQSCGGYTLRGGTSPALRGLMTWSINWDRYYDWEFQRSHRPFLDGLP
ncbi:chitinase [Amycolatopsis cihanbeyliensis]|uniref:chitinase n=1 Tax=Amycolatopsis cihanbeyliensis TaxID=1128664 RepID=A0A542DFK8_AMYCI|nr:cellulose binding domain-containing protein [Amycolatopsis cihanbeyliensis]TQJ01846.1 chitinase [Amycolatopsis cihanbeyliensis]